MPPKWRQQKKEKERHSTRVLYLGLFCSVSNVFAYAFLHGKGIVFWFHHEGYALVRLSPLLFCFCMMVGEGLHYLMHGPTQAEERRALWWSYTYLCIEGSMFLSHLIGGYSHWTTGIQSLLEWLD